MILVDAEVLRMVDALAGYRQRLAELPVPVEVFGDPLPDFRVRMRQTDLDPGAEMSINTLRGAELVIRRTEATVKRRDPGGYRLLVNLAGTASLEQDGRGGAFDRYDMGLYDTSKPFRVDRSAVRVPSSLAWITFPRDRLALPASLADKIVGARLSGRRGVGGVVAALVRRLAGEAVNCSPADAARLGASTVDMISVLLAGELQDESRAANEVRHRSLLPRVQHFIDINLGDQGLDPAAIAAAHHVSVRHLHRLFQEHGLTISGWIRERRLERCRRDLLDPLQQARPVGVIGARWGFRSEPHFSRTFRAAYGVAPGEWRIRQFPATG
jgi:AraC-like DNA-binding protein